MSFSNNYPTVGPVLNLDFINNEALDPRVTFTRASTATYYNGVTTAVAEQNLLVQSQDFTTTWATSTATVSANAGNAPDGTATADKVLPDLATTGRVQQTLTTTTGITYTFSCFVKADGFGWVALGMAAPGAYFDLSGAGTVGTTPAGYTASITSVGSGWYRCVVTLTETGGAARTWRINPASADNTLAVGDGTSGILVWGAQLEQRSSATAYTATTTQPITNYIPVLLTAQNNVPRFDHNPTTGVALGLEIEEQRTNLETYSEDFSNAVWVKTNSTISSNAIIAPSGQLTGDKLIADATTSIHSMTIPSRVYTINVAYAMSIFAKAGEYNTFSIIRSGPGGASARFDLSTLTATILVGTSASITSVGNGWYRCEMTWTSTQTIARTHELRLENPSGTSTFLGDGYSGMFFWGIQTEAGAFATSYIPTTTTALTRNADIASMTGTNFSSWYNASEGTFDTQYFPYAVNPASAGQNVIHVSNGTATEQLQLTKRANVDASTRLVTDALGVSSTFLNLGTFTATQTKAAITYKVNDFAGIRSGGSLATDTSGAVPTPNQMTIGVNLTLTGSINGYIQRIAYYNYRVPNAQLQALTGA